MTASKCVWTFHLCTVVVYKGYDACHQRESSYVAAAATVHVTQMSFGVSSKTRSIVSTHIISTPVPKGLTALYFICPLTTYYARSHAHYL